ncbi:MAG TPA: nucleotidyltransferase [Burkholderiaceae bacterium]|nr:nucleotidyltransferase [Burkholderiaceae bacterium]
MALTYRQLVESADQLREHTLEKALRGQMERFDLAMWAQALDLVNRHITIDEGVVDNAATAYSELGNHLVATLKWPEDAISVLPQGSSSTQTLIAPPTRAKFDIDAVCEVDLSRIEARDPMQFFDEVGGALKGWDIEEKNRCWRVQYTNEPFYIDFTPAVPLSKIPAAIRAQVRLRPATRYQETALAVVDRPTKSWKTSNPRGFAAWINDQARRRVLRMSLVEHDIVAKRADVDPIPEQEVPLSDTLRVAIRLFKRHRDMAVRRNLVTSDTAPISVIIVTLLTQCYEGLADSQRQFDHPIELLLALAETIPHMIENSNGQYWIANPTVEGENFAERWNGDNGERYKSFRRWCQILTNDLLTILSATDPDTIRQRVQTVFGCTGADPDSGGVRTLGLLAPAQPKSAPAARPGRGLA